MSIALGTPLAEALNASIQEKLVEIGWSVAGEDSSPLSEYICLMLVNGKSQEQIAEELSGDLLGLSKEDDSATVFSAWLFGKVEELKGTQGGDTAGEQDGGKQLAEEQIQMGAGGDGSATRGDGSVIDHEMGESGGPPTGPKAMRGAGPRQGRERLFSQLNKAMERSPQDHLRRVRHQPGERVEKREPPKGPRNTLGGPRNGMMGQQQQQGGLQGIRPGGPGRGNGQMGRIAPAFPQPAGGIPPHLAGQIATMNPQQQMAFFQMIEQQNQILAGFMSGVQGQQPGMMGMPPQMQAAGPNGYRGPQLHPQFGNQFSNVPHHPQFQQQQQQQQQKPQRSLFDMIEKPPQIVNPPQQEAPDEEMDVVKDVTEKQGFVEDREGEKPKEEDPFKTACKFANGCTKPDCPFAHPAPLSVGRVNISFVEKCPFGVNCKNRKCIGAHPSPVSVTKPPRPTLQADCKFWPNCKNPVCPFRHPEISMPLCRNGPNCTRPDCHFTHTETPRCKYNPCLNPNCIYTHEEGQQQGAFDNKVWTADGAKKQKEHVSERRFVAGEEEEEELIIPGQQPVKKTVGKSAGEGSAGTGEEELKPPGSAASTDSSHTIMNQDMETVQEEEMVS